MHDDEIKKLLYATSNLTFFKNKNLINLNKLITVTNL